MTKDDTRPSFERPSLSFAGPDHPDLLTRPPTLGGLLWSLRVHYPPMAYMDSHPRGPLGGADE